jgi:hypothetical protein
MVQLNGSLGSSKEQLISQGLQFPAAMLYHLCCSLYQADEKVVHFLTDFGGRAKTGIGRHLFTHPFPDRLIGVEIRAVGWQVHQAQLEVGRSQIGTDGFAPMGWAVIPNHDEQDRASSRATVSGTLPRFLRWSCPRPALLPLHLFPDRPPSNR